MDRMKFTHLFEKFMVAVDVLATSPASLQKRLEGAYRSFIDIEPKDFDDEAMQATFEQIRSRLTRVQHGQIDSIALFTSGNRAPPLAVAKPNSCPSKAPATRMEFLSPANTIRSTDSSLTLIELTCAGVTELPSPREARHCWLMPIHEARRGADHVACDAR
jgi:hypothetical protein